MSDKPKWLQRTAEFLIDNISVLATLGTASYVIFRQSNAATKFSTDDLIAAVLAVLGLLALSEFIERYRRLNAIEKVSKQTLALLENRLAEHPSALSFFVKLPNIENHIKFANQIDMCGVTLTSTINRQLSNIRERLKQGATVRILVADPESLALKMSDLRSEDPSGEYYRQKLETTLQDLEYLHNHQTRLGADAKGKFEVRLLQFAPSFGFFSFDTHHSNGIVIIEMYPHVSGWGAEPCFDLTPKRDGGWYGYFVDQFEQMWKGAKSWQPKNKPLN
ncbi:MAG: hypothetical protein SFY66_22340 [Oculatellaceae cyanobacterium bins.114]|nr:hypothetical protein [Oculatellaceae cyanobacterium bins.114]